MSNSITYIFLITTYILIIVNSIGTGMPILWLVIFILIMDALYQKMIENDVLRHKSHSDVVCNVRGRGDQVESNSTRNAASVFCLV